MDRQIACLNSDLFAELKKVDGHVGILVRGDDNDASLRQIGPIVHSTDLMEPVGNSEHLEEIHDYRLMGLAGSSPASGLPLTCRATFSERSETPLLPRFVDRMPTLIEDSIRTQCLTAYVVFDEIGGIDMKAKARKWGLIALAVVVMTGVASKSVAAEVWTEADGSDNAWVYGTDIHAFSCWSAGGAKPMLQIRVGGKWVSKTRAFSFVKNSTLCKESGYRFAAKYKYVLDELGTPTDADGQYKLQVREIIPGTTSRKTVFTPPWVKEVYESQEALMATYANVLEQLLQGTGGTSGGAGGGLGSGSSTSNWVGCRFRGKNMYGSVKVVDYGYADFTVKRVSFAPDLRVKLVQYYAYSCGEWKIVDYGFADFTVKIVDYGYADFTIQLVDFAPGR